MSEIQTPISPDTLLNNRYRVTRVLGQGGFARTYLAEDEGRFNESCVLKELIPNQDSEYVLEKSRELFQREATTLYQIQHPQVPQFRSTFEEDGRLFFVQDYVEGKTYRELLGERRSRGQTFSEAEVLDTLQQLLPVLSYIHNKGIIHRDIAPDNIILPDAPIATNEAGQQISLPVLIDFGVVKQLATQFQSEDINAIPTTVGKLGYAPPEQIQRGQAYPSSDLYSLAVTAIVMLTGKPPSELYDDVQLSWNWRTGAGTDEQFANVLNRMLAHQPGDRYQSADEVFQALAAISSPTTTTILTPPPQPAQE
ncbi:MAG: serine/threonine-protein kinase, partial [Spirulinaceae cyanobacterium]